MATTQAKVTTAWGPATVAEEVALSQRVGDRRFGTLVQLLETRNGDSVVRFSYTTDGTVRRGPVTLRARDLERLRAALATRPRLREALGM